MNRMYILMVSLVVCLLSSTAAVAHEPRVVNDAMRITVGWRVEPALVNQLNRFDMILADFDGNPRPASDLDLRVSILYLKEDAADAKIISKARLSGELRPDRDSPHRYNITVLPTKVGAYGFHIKGMIDGVMVDEVFICRGGSQNPDGRSFGCVEDVQTFPSKGKRKNDDDDDDH